MGDVDLNDQMRSTYAMENTFKSRRWYKKLYLGLFGIACTNAFILSKISKNMSTLTHENFQLELSSYLVHAMGEEAQVDPNMADEEPEEHLPVYHQNEDTGVKHDWVKMTSQPRCRVCSIRKGDKKTVGRTWWFCRSCSNSEDLIPLHHPDHELDCWKTWHTPRLMEAAREARKAARAARRAR
jgi:hypothetical protein